MERLTTARKKTVGTKQTQKAIEKDQAIAVYIARDTEERISAPLMRMCAEKEIEVVMVDTMDELGRLCGIKVGAATAAVIT